MAVRAVRGSGIVGAMPDNHPSPVTLTTIEPKTLRSSGDTLELLANNWPPAERQSQAATLIAGLHSGKDGEFVILEARRAGQLVGAALAQALPGRAAVVWAPQLVGGEEKEIGLLLLAELQRRLAAAEIHVAQSLVIAENAAEAELFQTAGYQLVGELVYMACEAARFPRLPPAITLTTEAYTRADDARLARIIDATYERTLDCPLVNGLRETSDVLDGYRAVGQPRPDLWQFLRQESEDVGCLLLAAHAAQRQWELVYLGLAPAARGRGLGLALTQLALWMAGREGAQRMVLAVDSANRPALDLYQTAGFVPCDSRRAWVLSLRSAS